MRAYMKENVLEIYNRQNISFKKGYGVWLYSDNGDKFLDCASGIDLTNGLMKVY